MQELRSMVECYGSFEKYKIRPEPFEKYEIYPELIIWNANMRFICIEFPYSWASFYVKAYEGELIDGKRNQKFSSNR